MMLGDHLLLEVHRYSSPALLVASQIIDAIGHDHRFYSEQTDGPYISRLDGPIIDWRDEVIVNGEPRKNRRKYRRGKSGVPRCHHHRCDKGQERRKHTQMRCHQPIDPKSSDNSSKGKKISVDEGKVWDSDQRGLMEQVLKPRQGQSLELTAPKDIYP